MTPADLATLSLLDPDQGVCPNGHPSRLSEVAGERICAGGEYRGLALICWEITSDAIERAERGGADPIIVAWGRTFLAEKPA
jgi:hypothetical protein